MDFRRGRRRDEPDINLVPFIDVLLVIVIFLAVTTTYSKYSELQINLPTADATKANDRPEQINVAVTATGGYVVGRTPVTVLDTRGLQHGTEARGGLECGSDDRHQRRCQGHAPVGDPRARGRPDGRLRARDLRDTERAEVARPPRSVIDR